MTSNRKVQATFELVFAGMLWGFGFIAAVWALYDIGPFSLTALRFALASAVGLLICVVNKTWRPHLNRQQWRLALIPGLLLSTCLVFQTWGLKYTTATKSGFITSLYVLMVPILEVSLLKRRLPRFHPTLVAVALVGTAFIVELIVVTSDGSGLGWQGRNWNRGDFLTFICALAASLHIFWFGRIAERISSAFTFNTLQTVWALLFALPFTFFASGPLLPSTPIGWSGLLMLAFGSTLLAFMLQVRAQKILSPSAASLLFLLESPFATLFAVSLLHETLSESQWLGAALILFSVGVASWTSTRASNH